MRDLFIAVILFFWVPVILFKPHIGVLMWDWISHMNPHASGHGFATTFPFLDFVAAMTFVGFMMSGDEKKLPPHPILLAMVLFFLWTVVTTFTGFNPDYSTEKLIRFFKVILFAILTLMIMQSPGRIKSFVGIMVVGLLAIGVKGGLFTLMTGGAGRVEGAGGMMGDNNQLAVAMAMLIPMTVFWVQHPPRPWLKWPTIISALLVAVCVIGTTSRGGAAALAITGGALLLKSRRKFLVMALMIPLGFGLYQVTPESTKAKFATAGEATSDSSFRGRAGMWKFAVNLASDYPVEGGGFNTFFLRKPLELYLPFGEARFAAHSIYFEVLGEHGYVGLILFMTMIFTGWFSAGRNYALFKQYKETLWLADLSNAVRVALVAYCAGGALLNISTFDLLYHYLAVVILAEVVGMRMIEKGVTTIEEAKRLEQEAAEAEAEAAGQKGFRPGVRKPGKAAPSGGDGAENGGGGELPDPVLGRTARPFARHRD